MLLFHHVDLFYVRVSSLKLYKKRYNKHLFTDKEHRLRVIAVNAEGESEALAGVDSFRTENPYGPPSAPSKPWMVDVDMDHFDMKWEAPKNDGGSRVTGYHLESRLWKDSVWFK